MYHDSIVSGGKCRDTYREVIVSLQPCRIRSGLLFADGCVLYRNIHSIQNCFVLQEDLTSLEQWEADWQMKFNVAKCHSMRVTRHQHHKQILFDFSLHNQTLENVQSANYLGIASDFILDFGKLPFPTHLGKYFIKIGKIRAKKHKIGKIKAIFGLGMTPIYGLKNAK